MKWLKISAVIVVIIGLMAGGAVYAGLKPQSNATTPKVMPVAVIQPPDAFANYQADLLSQLNAVRSQNGVAAVSLTAPMNQAAANRCQDLIDLGVFTHYDGIHAPDYYITQAVGDTPPYDHGENIAEGNWASPQAVTTAFTNSPEHFTNMVRSSFVQVGFAKCVYTHGTYIGPSGGESGSTVTEQLSGKTLFVEEFSS